MDQQQVGRPVRSFIRLGIAAVVLIVGALAAFGALEVNDAKHVMVVQSLAGNLNCYTDAGPKPQWWGKVTTYKKREEFSFSAKTDQGRPTDESIKVRFNDGGSASVSGVVNWEMPLACEKIIALHTAFGSQHAVEQQLVRPTFERVIYLSGPTMSSTESYAARRNEFLQFVEDQAKNGIYRTIVEDVKVKDAITGQEKTAQVVRIVRDAKGVPERLSPSAFSEFGVVLLPLTINQIKYDDIVEKQIAEAQRAVAQVQIAQANAREAEQRAITAEKHGQAAAMKAKWEIEETKAREVTAAEAKRSVAELDMKTADLEKRAKILRGEGEAEARRLAMAADQALDRRLVTYEKVQGMWSSAFKDFKGQVVPQVVTGGGASSNAALEFMNFMMVKAAKDLAVNPTMPAPPTQEGTRK